MRLVLSALALAAAVLAACATENTAAIEQGARDQCAALHRENDQACLEETMANMRAAEHYDPQAAKRRPPPSGGQQPSQSRRR